MLKFLICYPHEKYGEVIDVFEGPGRDPCHVAIILDNGLLEALFTGVTISELDSYADYYTEMWGLNAPQEENLSDFAAKSVGRHYSRAGLVQAWCYQWFGVQLPLKTRWENICSGLATDAVRVCGVDLFPGVPSNCVTPKLFLAELRKRGVKYEE